MESQDFNIAVEKLQQAGRVAVITGAGISAESGIRTFRDADGLWEQFSLEDVATPEGFQRNPKRVWQWYAQRRNEYRHAQPNAAHETLVKMEHCYQEFLVITQNVDTLHAKAGTRNLIELHGNILKARCTACAHVFDNPHTTIPENLIRCPSCQALARPHIVWFGEMYDTEVLRRISNFLAKTDVVLVVGTSGMVSTPVYFTLEAIEHGAYAIDINPNESEVSRYAHCRLKANAANALPKLWQAVSQSTDTMPLSC